MSIFDVRSPGEYNHAHIPNANSLPLFNDEERKIVGTAYKQQGKQPAIKIGLDFFGLKMKTIVEEVEQTTQNNTSNTTKSILVHCWRGGMRSAGVAWLLDLYGFDVYLLVGGYKAYRNWALQQFEKEYSINILGGYTGSGKTEILSALQSMNENTIDLEGLANHKGSAFGGIGQAPQTSQEMFENTLALALHKTTNNTNTSVLNSFWLEDESQRIGKLNIPHALWKTIRNQMVYFIEIPFEERLNYIVKNYAPLDKEKLIEAVARIQKRLGPLETKTTVSYLKENNFSEAFKVLLMYYDKTYTKSMHNRENIDKMIQKITLSAVYHITNAKNILLEIKK